jgi:hypothetical protein
MRKVRKVRKVRTPITFSLYSTKSEDGKARTPIAFGSEKHGCLHFFALFFFTFLELCHAGRAGMWRETAGLDMK